MPRYEGRLELTWTNKHLRLLADGNGSYEWLEPSDYRMAEVRLLHDSSTVGEVSKNRAIDNLLIRGDALHALTSLAKLPEFAREYLGKVKLAYLDPPFNTGQAFEYYDDALEHSVWLTMMRDRLQQIKALLSDEGSVWVHLDDSEAHRARCVLDEIFGADRFVATVSWQKVYSPRMDAKQFSSSHDHLIIYANGPGWRPNRQQIPADQKSFSKRDSNGLRYRLRSLRKEGKGSLREDRPNLWYPIIAPDGTVVFPIKPDGTEGRWRWGPDRYESENDSIEWVLKDGRYQAFLRQYEDPDLGRPPETLWLGDDVGHNHQAIEHIKRMFPGEVPFTTPKPERLLKQIIEIGTSAGDIVLDCFVGSGTTAAVAHKMDRRWVAVEREADTIGTFCLPRLRKVVEGVDPGGVTGQIGWRGGGGFRVLDIAPSMFQADQGLVVLAEGMTNGRLAEATAAQLGFEYQADPPFAGRKGRIRLAVVDGVVNPAVVRLLAQCLDTAERVVICGTGIDTDARPILRELRPGSTLRKIPATLLSEYRSARATFDKPIPAEVGS